jgi:hypothetical protein
LFRFYGGYRSALPVLATWLIHPYIWENGDAKNSKSGIVRVNPETNLKLAA